MMTYNFDPDRWLEAHRAAAEARRERGEISDEEYRAELLDLDRRYEEMVNRLDGTYEIPEDRAPENE
jgi:hypothetical protein